MKPQYALGKLRMEQPLWRPNPHTKVAYQLQMQ
jgi:hypothetical protein